MALITTCLFFTPAVHGAPSPDFIDPASVAGLTPKLYILIGNTYILFGFASVAVTCWRVAAHTHGYRTQALSLLAECVGCAFGFITVLSTDVRVLSPGMSAPAVSVIFAVNQVSGFLTLFFVSLGLVVPVTVRLFGRLLRDIRLLFGLRDLWELAAVSFPAVVMARPSTRNPIERLDIAAMRRKIEVDDALALATVSPAIVQDVRRAADPVATLGVHLGANQPWRSAPDQVRAADLLPEVDGFKAEVRQLRSLAVAVRLAEPAVLRSRQEPART